MLQLDDPDHNSRWQAELERLGWLDRVEPFVDTVRALDDFVRDGRWLGISKEMDRCLSSVILNGRVYGEGSTLERECVLRIVSVTTTEPIHTVSLTANELVWFKGETSGLTELNPTFDQHFTLEPNIEYISMSIHLISA